MAYISNNEQMIRTEVADFMIAQRNTGYANNDGQWVVSQLPELYYGTAGVLYRRRAGKFLGVYADLDAVRAAIDSATAMPIVDEMVR